MNKLFMMMFGGNSTPVPSLPIEAMASDFSGYTRLNATDIALADFVEFQVTGEAPFMLRVAATDTTATGLRFSGKTIKPLTDLDYRWTVTKADLSPVLYEDELINPQDGSVYNPYTDTIGCEAAFYLREAGDYIVTCEIRGARTDGQVIKQTFSKTYTVTESTTTHKWFDGTAGLDTNDGLDPWGFALTAASYDDSTYTLTQTGAFTSLVMDTEYPQNSSNFIYLTGGTGINAGLYEIASKSSNDTIVLKKSAGATAIDVTSSNGALQTFTGVPVTTATNGVIHHLAGGNTYDITGEMFAQPGWDGGTSAMYKPKGVWAYGGSKATVRSSTLNGSTGLINLQTGASGNMVTSFSVDNLIVDGDGVNKTLGGTHTSTKVSSLAFSIVNCDLLKSLGGGGGSVQTTDQNATVSFTLWGGSLDNRRLAAESRSLALYTQMESTDCWFASVCWEVSGVSDNFLLDHYIYENGAQNHSMHHHLYAHPPAGVTGQITSYTLNLNCLNDGGSRFNTTIVGGKYVDSDWGVDASNGLNTYDNKTFDNLFIYNVESNVKKSFFAAASCFNTFIKDVRHVGSNYTSAAFFHAGWGSGVLDKTAYTLTLENNKVYDQPLLGAATGINFEAYGNASHNTWAGDSIYAEAEVDTTILGVGNALVIDNNTIYAPNNTSGNLYKLDGVAGVTLATFNAGVNGTNYDTDPGWIDFPPATSKVLTLGSPDRIATFTAPSIGSTDDFNISFDVMVRTGTPSIPYTKFLRLSTNSPSEVRVGAIDNSLEFKMYTTVATFSVPAFTYDTWVNVRLRRVSGALSVSINGGAYSASQPFSSTVSYDEISQVSTDVISMKNLKIENVTTVTLVQYNLNSGELVSEAADIGTGTITYTNPLWS